MSALVISAYPACGKSYYYKKHSLYAESNGDEKVLDSDSSNFSWLYDEAGNKTDIRNPDFPNNYIDYIKKHLDKEDIIFVSSHESVREALHKNGIPFAMVVPDIEMKAEWLSRMKKRGNDDVFIQLQEEHWDEWVSDCLKDNRAACTCVLTPEHPYLDEYNISNTRVGMKMCSELARVTEDMKRQTIEKAINITVDRLYKETSVVHYSPMEQALKQWMDGIKDAQENIPEEIKE